MDVPFGTAILITESRHWPWGGFRVTQRKLMHSLPSKGPIPGVPVPLHQRGSLLVSRLMVPNVVFLFSYILFFSVFFLRIVQNNLPNQMTALTGWNGQFQHRSFGSRDDHPFPKVWELSLGAPTAYRQILTIAKDETDGQSSQTLYQTLNVSIHMLTPSGVGYTTTGPRKE